MVLASPGRVSGGDSAPRRAPLPRLSGTLELSVVLKSVRAILSAALSDSSLYCCHFLDYKVCFLHFYFHFMLLYHVFFLSTSGFLKEFQSQTNCHQ